MAGAPKEPDRCEVKHEIEALILTGIRVRAAKRRRKAVWGVRLGILVNHNWPPLSPFSYVFILKVVKVLCFDTLL